MLSAWFELHMNLVNLDKLINRKKALHDGWARLSFLILFFTVVIDDD